MRRIDPPVPAFAMWPFRYRIRELDSLLLALDAFRAGTPQLAIIRQDTFRADGDQQSPASSSRPTSQRGAGQKSSRDGGTQYPNVSSASSRGSGKTRLLYEFHQKALVTGRRSPERIYYYSDLRAQLQDQQTPFFEVLVRDLFKTGHGLNWADLAFNARRLLILIVLIGVVLGGYFYQLGTIVSSFQALGQLMSTLPLVGPVAMGLVSAFAALQLGNRFSNPLAEIVGALLIVLLIAYAFGWLSRRLHEHPLTRRMLPPSVEDIRDDLIQKRIAADMAAFVVHRLSNSSFR